MHIDPKVDSILDLSFPFLFIRHGNLDIKVLLNRFFKLDLNLVVFLRIITHVDLWSFNCFDQLALLVKSKKFLFNIVSKPQVDEIKQFLLYFRHLLRREMRVLLPSPVLNVLGPWGNSMSEHIVPVLRSIGVLMVVE